MTTNELMEFCKNLAMLRRWRDEGGSSLDDATLIALTERLRAGRQRVQDVYRTVRDRLEAVLDYGKVALGEEDFLAAKREIDDAPPEPPRKRGRPAKKQPDDLPGQGDLYADQAADQARSAEDERRAQNPDLALDLEIMAALRNGGRLSTEEIAEHVVRPRLDVAQRIAELESQGQIRPCQHARGRWEIPPQENFDSFAPGINSEPHALVDAGAPPSESKIDPSDAQGGAFPGEAEEELEGGQLAPYRQAARQALTEPTTTKALVDAWRKQLGCSLGEGQQTLKALVAEGTLVLDATGKRVAVKRDDTDPFAHAAPAPAAAPEMEEAPL